MQLLLAVIYVLAQILGNGGSAEKSAPAYNPQPRYVSSYYYALLNSNCKLVPVEPSEEEDFQGVSFLVSTSEQATEEEETCPTGTDQFNSAVIEAVQRSKREGPRIAIHDI